MAFVKTIVYEAGRQKVPHTLEFVGVQNNPYIDFTVTCKAIGGNSNVRRIQPTVIREFIASAPTEEERIIVNDSTGQPEEVSGGNPWNPKYKLAKNISDLMSEASGRAMKYNERFADLAASTQNTKLQLKEVEGKNGEQWTFRFPMSVRYSSDQARLSGLNTALLSDMKYFLEEVVTPQLKGTYQKLSNISSAVTHSYGDSDLYNGIAAHIPKDLIVIGDKEKYEEWVKQQLQGDIQEGAGTGLTDEQREQSLPLNEQAILLYRIGELLEYNRQKRNEDEYDRFATLECKEAAQIETLVNYMTSPPDASSLFDTIRPMHLSAIIPRVRLWKKYHWEEERVSGGGSSANEPVFIEYEFEEHIDPSLLGETLTTNTGVGLESFNWEFNGDNTFSAEKLIQAQLKLRAQSIDALEKKRRSSNSSSSGKDEYAFSDIFIPDKRRKNKKGNRPVTGDYQEYDLKNMKTRVEIEYSVDKGSYVFSDLDGKNVAESLDKLKLTLNLSVNKYAIDLRDDGSVGVTVDFWGSIDSTTGDPNSGDILPDQSFTEDQKKSLLEERRLSFKTVDDLQKEKDDLIAQRTEALENQSRQSTLSEKDKAIEEKNYKEAMKKFDETIKKEQNRTSQQLGTGEEADEKYLLTVAKKEFDRKRLYQTILMGLLKRGVVHQVVVDPSDIAKTTQDIAKGQKDLGFTSNEEMNIWEKNWTADIYSEGKNLKIKQMSSFLDRLDDRLNQDVLPMYTDSRYYIKFFYFGDLLDVVLDNMYSATAKDRDVDIRTVLGPIEIERNVFSSDTQSAPIRFLSTGKIVVSSKGGTYDPAATREMKAAINQADSYQQRKSKAAYNGKPPPKKPPPVESVMASLADVPISLNLFLRWFADKVSNKGLFGYSFKNFLVDATQSLIVAALQADSARILLPKQKRQLRTVMWDGATTSDPDPFGFVMKPQEGLKNVLTTKERNKNSKAGSQLARVQKEIQKSYKLGGGAPMSNYLLIYASSVKPIRKYSGKQSEYERDIKDGVYHLSLGRDVGVVKDIKLTAPSVPGYEEMQLQKARKTGGIVTKRIYSASITMYGITFFRPGQMIYIEPAAYGSRDNLKAHGLCGYYTVRTTSNNFAAGQFETTLECEFYSEG